MARTIKFSCEKAKQLYDDFLVYLSTRIPAYRMPAKDCYNKFNTSIKSYLNKNGYNVVHIVEISDINNLERILLDIQSAYVYMTKEDLKVRGLKLYIDFLKERDKCSNNNSCEVKIISEISEEYKEGSLLDCHGTKYERNLKAREQCLKYYGYTCRVCGFDFEKVYGARGMNFIEVHHKVPLSEIACGEHIVDPEKDLIQVCSNCHAMIHRTRPAISVEDLIKIINKG